MCVCVCACACVIMGWLQGVCVQVCVQVCARGRWGEGARFVCEGGGGVSTCTRGVRVRAKVHAWR